jgi:hypothetical protein
MGTIHKFKRPPKNEQQFRSYSPRSPQRPGKDRPQRLRLRDWQRSAIAWLMLLLVSAAIWFVGFLLGDA